MPGGGLDDPDGKTRGHTLPIPAALALHPVEDNLIFWEGAQRETEEESGGLPPNFDRAGVVDTTLMEDRGWAYKT